MTACWQSCDTGCMLAFVQLFFAGFLLLLYAKVPGGALAAATKLSTPISSW
mgnify:CR=1 FL=1